MIENKETMKRFLLVIGVTLSVFATSCKSLKENEEHQIITDESLMDSVQYRTFLYFWDAAEPNSGLARERYHMDGEYPLNDKNVVTSGGSGFGIMAIVIGMDRGFITREQGIERLDKIVSFLETADNFKGVFPHWWDGETGETKAFSLKDDGGDLVETSFLIQGLLVAHQYLNTEDEREALLANRIDTIWRSVNWDWYRNNQNVLFWHWSTKYEWEMDFPIRGFNECLITYVLATCSPTYGVPAEVYHEGWAENGDIISPHETEGYPLNMRYQGTEVGPMFWAHYSFLGLNPTGLKDQYADYFKEMKNYTLINRAYCIRNPKGYKGYGHQSWGLSASYTVDGYMAHQPKKEGDKGVITPTAALSSIVYTPEESLEVMHYLYSNLGDKMWGKYGFYDAYSETEDWYPQRYLAIDQGPIVVMIENYRTGLIWNLFMSHPDVQAGLDKLGFTID